MRKVSHKSNLSILAQIKLKIHFKVFQNNSATQLEILCKEKKEEEEEEEERKKKSKNNSKKEVYIKTCSGFLFGIFSTYF